MKAELMKQDYPHQCQVGPVWVSEPTQAEPLARPVPEVTTSLQLQHGADSGVQSGTGAVLETQRLYVGEGELNKSSSLVHEPLDQQSRLTEGYRMARFSPPWMPQGHCCRRLKINLWNPNASIYTNEQKLSGRAGPWGSCLQVGRLSPGCCGSYQAEGGGAGGTACPLVHSFPFQTHCLCLGFGLFTLSHFLTMSNFLKESL